MPAGRPSSYKPEYAGQAEKLCRLGATDEELADFFEVDVRTIYRWQHAHEEFCQALKTGKEAADERVERSLYHRAIGYCHEDVHITSYQGDVTLTPIVKHYPPDTVAAIFWLKNRRADLWRDKTESRVEHDVSESFVEALRLLNERRDSAVASGLDERPDAAPVRH